MTRPADAWAIVRDELSAAIWRLRLLIRPPQPVIYGGRPDADRWIGSPEDLRLAERERRLAALELALRRIGLRMATAMAPAVNAARKLGMSAERAARNLQRASAMLTPEAQAKLDAGERELERRVLEGER